ncbi:MAG: hypothetical protein ABJF11_03765 [Reichenbachiella sp.]|uniref:hypothetical protein n=1 Tax=Reichenbachiella sp. TaxID=2184521 RepID=UPI0032662FF3
MFFIKKLALLTAILPLFISQVSAQEGIGIGTESVNSDAVLEIESKTKGLLIPRMNAAQRVATGATSAGLIVYDTSNKAFYYYDGSDWLRLVAQPGQINLNMNSHKIVNVTNGTASKDAVNKGQLDTKLNLSGGTMSGNITMGSNRVRGLANGSSSGDAVNKGQLDTEMAKRPLTTDVINIGSWNMDQTSIVYVDFNSKPYDAEDIRMIQVLIRTDSDVSWERVEELASYGVSANVPQGGIERIYGKNAGNSNPGTILLSRRPSGAWDGANYDQTSYNRGWITIQYQP